MKKEALLAIFIGIVVGLAITYGIYQIRQRFAPVDTAQSPVVSPQSDVVAPTGTEKLFITSPQNESVLDDAEITLSGTTESKEIVVVFVNDREYVTQADDIGAFALKIQLDEGSNVMQITSLNTDGSEEVKELVVIRDPAGSTSEDETATESAEIDN